MTTPTPRPIVAPAPTVGHCTERGCVFPAFRHGLCLHHLRIWGGKSPVRVNAAPTPTLCDCGKQAHHRGRCFGLSQARRGSAQLAACDK